MAVVPDRTNGTTAQDSRLNDSDFRQLILVEFDSVFRLACHLTRGRQEADDLVQETYVRALRSAATFTLADYGVRPWLFKILHNVIFSRGAKGQREREVMDDLRHEPRPPHASDPRADDATIDWDGVDERLKSAVEALQTQYRVVFLLSAVEGLKYREIADVTGVPIGTVMSRLSRARTTLAERLNGLAAELRIDTARFGDAEKSSKT